MERFKLITREEMFKILDEKDDQFDSVVNYEGKDSEDFYSQFRDSSGKTVMLIRYIQIADPVTKKLYWDGAVLFEDAEDLKLFDTHIDVLKEKEENGMNKMDGMLEVGDLLLDLCGKYHPRFAEIIKDPYKKELARKIMSGEASIKELGL